MNAVLQRRGVTLVQLGLAAGMTLAIAGPARAQVSLAASLDSDYRLRGYSLTDERPALSASIGYDMASGIYVGASGVAGDAPGSGPKALGYIAYGGYAHRFSDGRSLDVGLSRTQLKAFDQSRWTYLSYTEAYLGVSSEHFSLRALYSPRYIRDGAKSLYVDLGASMRPAERWRVSGHAGLLRYLEQPRSASARATQYDLRAVVAREFDHGDVHLAWTMHGPDAGAASARHEGGDNLGVGLTYVF